MNARGLKSGTRITQMSLEDLRRFVNANNNIYLIQAQSLYSMMRQRVDLFFVVMQHEIRFIRFYATHTLKHKITAEDVQILYRLVVLKQHFRFRFKFKLPSFETISVIRVYYYVSGQFCFTCYTIIVHSFTDTVHRNKTIVTIYKGAERTDTSLPIPALELN